MLRRSIGSHGFIEFWRGSKIFLREPESSRGLKICRWSKPQVGQKSGLYKFCIAPKFTMVQKCKLAQKFKLAWFKTIMCLRMCMHKLELLLLFLKIRSIKILKNKTNLLFLSNVIYRQDYPIIKMGAQLRWDPIFCLYIKDFCIVKRPYIVVDSHPSSGSYFVLVEEGNSPSQTFY